MKKLIPLVLFVAVALILASYLYPKFRKKSPLICNEKYALCSAAQCIPDPKNPTNSICFCDVFEGKNYGFSPCVKRKPRLSKKGVEYLISTFSLENPGENKNMTCESGNSWSNCLDQPCTVDPMDPKKAICVCKVVNSGSFLTLGGNCDKSNCSRGFWSGTNPESGAQGVEKMVEALGLRASPIKFCPKK